eukprot:gene8879-828_t
MEETEYKKPKIESDWENIRKKIFSIIEKFQQNEFQIIDLISSKNEKLLEKYEHSISLNDPEFVKYISYQAKIIKENIEKEKEEKEWKNIMQNLFSIKNKFQQNEFQTIDDLVSSKNKKFLEKYRHGTSKISLIDPEFIGYISEQAKVIEENQKIEKLEKEKILNFCMSSIRYGVEQKIINEKEKTLMQGDVLFLQPGPLMEQLKNLMFLTLGDHEKKSLVIQLIQKELKK